MPRIALALITIAALNCILPGQKPEAKLFNYQGNTSEQVAPSPDPQIWNAGG